MMKMEDIYKEFEAWLQNLVLQQRAFAIYRLPWSDDCCLVLQESGSVECLHRVSDLGGRDGFVMAPFSLSSVHPAIIIRPDIMARGWTEIASVMHSSVFPSVAVAQNEMTTISNMRYEDAEQESYQAAFERFIKPLKEGHFEKLVLSRTMQHELQSGFSLLNTFLRACKKYPRMMVYLCHSEVTGTWMGSTPEILLSGEGHAWHTVALAGTMPIQENVVPTKWSVKNREEQEVVAAYIRNVLQRFGTELTEEGPYTSRAGQLVHLKTDFHFLISNPADLGNLLEELHPTPAVCGLPKQGAFDFILQEEGYDRSYYSGFVGRLNPMGRTDIYVNLRCMEIFSDFVRLYAGGGILSQSVVTSEWIETEEKIKTMLCVVKK